MHARAAERSESEAGMSIATQQGMRHQGTAHLLDPPALLLATTCLVACGAETRAAGDTPAPDSAVCVLRPVGDSGVSGTIRFERTDGAVHVTGTVTGLGEGAHGFHIHEFGNLTDASSGQSAGSHFAPEGSPHGRPSDAERHVGDLGNIVAGADGKATVDITDDTIGLGCAYSIIGRALVVHAEADQFTQPTGDAGSRVAFGVIGIAQQ